MSVREGVLRAQVENKRMKEHEQKISDLKRRDYVMKRKITELGKSGKIQIEGQS